MPPRDSDPAPGRGDVLLAVRASRSWLLERVWLTPANRVLLLIVGTAALRLLAAHLMGLGVDESYMVAAGRDLRLGYYDHPPASWWLAWGASHLFGSEAAIVVRLPFIALFGVSTWLMYRLAAVLFGPEAGLWAAVTLNLAPVLGVTTASWVLPDGPLDCALLGAALCLVHALPARGRSALLWWLGAGLCAGLALFSKYTALLIMAGAVLYLLTQPQHRRWLLRPEPYLASGMAFLVFAPVLIWNAGHGWTSFAFQGGRVAAARFQPFGPIITLGGEALFLLPWLWLSMMLGAVAALRRGPQAWRSWLLCCLASLPIIVFALASAWSRGKVLFHWAAPGYLMLFPILGARVAEQLARGSRVTRVWLAGSAAFVCIALAVVATEIRFNWMPAIGIDFPAGSDPDLEAVDWTSLRTELAARHLLGQPGLAIAANNWLDAGKLGYALGDAANVTCLNTDARQFGIENPATRAIGQNVLIVAPRRTAEAMHSQLGSVFDDIESLPPLTLVHAGHPAMQVPLYLGHHLRAWPPPA